MRKRGQCIFCSGPKMSKEHFWPSWMGDSIQGDKGSYHTHKIITSDAKLGTNELIVENERQGDVTTKKIRVVCCKCNNGWMSQLETQAKPILEKLISGSKIKLCPDKRSILSAWVAMKVMVSEHSEGGTQVTPIDDRVVFCKKRVIPSYFRIYIGNHSTKHTAGFVRKSYLLAVNREKVSPKLKGLNKNTQVVSFYCGSLLIHIICLRVDSFNYTTFHDETVLPRIFPESTVDIEMPLVPINEEQVSNYVNALQSYIESDKVTYSGSV